MKTTKFAIIAAFSMLLMGFAGCMREPKTSEVGLRTLMLQLANVDTTPGTTTQAIEPGGQSGDIPTIDVARSFIYIISSNNPIGGDVRTVAMDEAANKTLGGQQIANVPTDAVVYVVANIPSADMNNFLAPASLDAIKALTSSITSQSGQYASPAMANDDGNAEAVVASGDALTVEIQLLPLVARLELLGVQGKTDNMGTITAFTVSGVYVDTYSPSFTYGGSSSGTLQKIDDPATDFPTWVTALMGNNTARAASGTPLRATASANAGDVWGYQIAPGDVPHIILEITDVEWTRAVDSQPMTPTDTYYLTVTGYSGLTGTFARGQGYRIGGAGKELAFGPENLALVPNATNASLTVTVEVVPWTFTDYEPIF